MPAAGRVKSNEILRWGEMQRARGEVVEGLKN